MPSPVGLSVFVHLLPALIPPGALEGGVALVVDVFRFTTVAVQALASGCDALIPCPEVDDALAAAAALPPGKALLAGERRGLPIAGFHLGNSPADFTPEVCRGKSLVMTTSNGTRAVLASLPAAHVGLAAVTNVDAAVNWAARFKKPVHVVCAGTEGEVSLEDTLLAGEIGLLLEEQGYVAGNDASMFSRMAYVESERLCVVQGFRWGEVVARGRGGRRVDEIELGRDLEFATDRTSPRAGLPVLYRKPLRLVWTPERIKTRG